MSLTRKSSKLHSYLTRTSIWHEFNDFEHNNYNNINNNNTELILGRTIPGTMNSDKYRVNTWWVSPGHDEQ